MKNLKRNFSKTSISLISLIMLSSCDTVSSPAPVKSSGTLPSDLQAQIDATSGSTDASAENNLRRAKVLYAQLVGGWNNINPIDIQAFNETKEKLIPMLFSAGNALTTSNKNENLKNDFREIYFDSLTNMMRGINGNIFTYQSLIDNPQLISTGEDKNTYSTEDLESLAKIFQATETTLFFVSQSGQFSTVITKDENEKILGGIKNQQISIINSLKLIITTNKLTKEQTQNAYNIVVTGLINPSLLTTLKDLAVLVFGESNVAFKQEQITAVKPNPNDIVMVIKEDSNTYRLISIDSNNLVNNKVIKDDRGLSASDIQNNSNVNIITTRS